MSSTPDLSFDARVALLDHKDMCLYCATNGFHGYCAFDTRLLKDRTPVTITTASKRESEDSKEPHK